MDPLWRRQRGEVRGALWQGDTPIVDKEELSTEWFDFRIYLINNCSAMTMKDVLIRLANINTMSTVYRNFRDFLKYF